MGVVHEALEETAFVESGSKGARLLVSERSGSLTSIQAEGFTVRSMRASVPAHFSLSIIGHGRSSGAVLPWYSLGLRSDANELYWHGVDMDVQYVNEPFGVRQNFIIKRASGRDGELVVHARSSGSVTPVLSDPTSLSFVDDAGIEQLRYEDLRVWDATGRILPAHMALGVQDEEGSPLSIIVDDRNAVYPITIDPVSIVPNTTLAGTQFSSEFGHSVYSAGDLNGDGYGDIVVGIRYGSQGQTDEGLAHVYYGSSAGIGAVPDVVLQVDQTGANFGSAVSTAGDVNGDGYSDLLVGAWRWESTGAEVNEGAVFVYHGGPTGINTTADQILQTDHASDFFGSNVAPAGDLNDDGYSDIIVGAYLAEYPTYQEGAVFIYLGGPGGLNGTFANRLERNFGAAHFGRSVASAGDVNGDGYSDVIIGASDFTNIVSDDGAAFVYYGGVNGLGLGINPAPDAILFGNATNNGSFGWSVSCAGDVNGDGYSDVVVGAYLDAMGQNAEGTAWVFHGSAAGISTTAATVLQSNQAGAWFGRSLTMAGDMNGDGYGDIVVGASLYTGPQVNEGGGYLYFGSPTGIGTTAAAVIQVNVAGGKLGESCGPAGDVNGDGYSDLIMGASIEGPGGKAYIFHGGPYSVNASPSRSWNGGAAGAQMGSSVASAGDVNGDGFADALVGAPNASPPRVEILLGSATGLPVAASQVLTNATAGFGSAICSAGDVNGNGLADIAIGAPGGNTVRIHHGSGVAVSAAPSLSLNGPGGSGFGTSVSTAGDVNSDGYADLIVGAPNSGQAYVYLGSGAGLSPVPHVVLTGTGEFGYSVSTAGDVNGDGYSDVIVGAPSASNGQPGEGIVYIYHGSMTGMVNVPAAVLEVNVANARFGHRVSNAGDVNGDGYFDVAIGAPQWASGQANEGGVFVYRGSATGITTTGVVTLQRNIVNGNMGLALQEAGDLNGDGYADIVVGAPLSETSGAESDEGLVYIYRGSQTGISAALIDALQSNTANAQMGFSVAGAGDVDGDGYSDLLVGAPGITGTFAGEGTAQWYRGGSARGIVRPTRQYLADLVSPLSTNSMDFSAPDFFGLGHFARNPIHRCDARLQWEVVFEGQPFSGLPITNSVAQSGTSAGWTPLPLTGAEIKELIYKTPNFIRYKWRVRVEYELAKGIDGQRFSRWFYGYATGHGDIGVLPVELIDLAGEARNEGNLITWRTATERGSDRFVVERSSDGTSFRELGALPAAGESIVLTEYSYLDLDAPHGIAYYRLNMIDLDGTQEYSPVIALRRGGAAITLYPVPASDELFVGFGERVENCSITVIDDVGRPAMTLQWGAVTSGEVRRIGVHQLAPGHYTLLVQDGIKTNVERRPFVKR